MTEQTLSSIMNGLDPDLLETIGQINMAIWHTDKKEQVMINVPFKVRKDILVFITALFSVFNMDLAKWFEKEMSGAIGYILDELKGFPISYLSTNIEILEKKLQNKD